MTTLKLIFLLLVISLYSCGQSSRKPKIDPEAIKLNKQAMTLVRYIDNPDSSRKAINLLDKATEIDSSYFLGYSNKLMFYYQLKLYDKALSTNNKLIQLRPNAHDLYLRSGLLCVQLGDTNSSKNYFTKSLSICNSVLDTMQRKNPDFVMMNANKAINLIMIGDSAKANHLLKTLIEKLPDDPEFDNVEKKYIKSLMGKNQKDLMQLINTPNPQSR